MHCESGRIYGIIGENGSGKTVLLKCICGFLRPGKGSILVDDWVMGQDMDVLDDVGVMIEEPAFLRRWNGYRNLDFLYSIRNKPNKEVIYDVMRTVHLDPKSRKSVGKYSLGMRQKLAIAQALMEDPSILLLDEPMNGLDHKSVEEMRKLFLKEKERGKLMIITSHNQEDIDVLCDEVFKMESGTLTKVR